ncbi:MAG: ABC transporter ATP-binding protein [Eubacteriales bacterium]|nr:ABC transporter ATP-binding protein [Eubacteriales bacterium]MDD4327152.1 ABC transporter ATP-binding protein [Eubacteriales bacterium]MDD4716806.1 ABC transporter ATP-binding protein [Eubacteriales bacterium]
MISITNLSKSYNGKVKAVDNISLEIPDGKIFGFLGPNGAGKTTTIKMITGILTPDSGNILVSGHDIVKEPLDAKRSFAYVPDDPDVFPRLKGSEYLKFIGDIYNVPSDLRLERMKDLSRKFGLEDVLGDRIQSYSHGMRQKLILIGALLHDPENWILDEPMTGLDPKSSFQLKDMMRRHADDGKTVFFSTHVLDVAEKVCDHIAIIDKGRILFNGTVEEMRGEVRNHASLESMFLELTGDTEE